MVPILPFPCLLLVLFLLTGSGKTHSEETASDMSSCEDDDRSPSRKPTPDQTNVDFTPLQCSSTKNDNDPGTKKNGTKRKLEIPEGCSLILGDSSIKDGGWGIFTLKPFATGEAIVHNGDPVIQIPDPNPQKLHGMRRLLWNYLWDGQEASGQYEGQRVMSTIPGIGMLANGDPNLHNVLPNIKPKIDNAGQTRTQSPGAGAFTHYHNLTWYAKTDIKAGDELFVNYGEDWFKERGYLNQPSPSEKRSIPWLLQNGYCLDNIIPGISTIDHAGRGAFASRDLEEGAIVAPVPVLPVSSESLGMMKQHISGRLIFTDQLIKNYCFGHSNSSLHLYPYSPVVNLINHDSQKPNVAPNNTIRVTFCAK